MEHRIHHQKSTKKLFNKIFHPGNSKKSTQVSPSSSPPGNHEWVPAYMSASDTSYELEKHANNRSTPNSPSALITTHYNTFPSPVYHGKTTDKHTITSTSEEDYHSDGDDNSITGRDSILTSSTGSLNRSSSIQRRYSFSNTHEASRQRLVAAKRAEYQEKMEAFDVLIQRRRCSTLRLALAPGVTGY